MRKRIQNHPRTQRMRCTLAGSGRSAPRWLLLAMLVLANFFSPSRGWTQTISVPLGSASRFGILSGATLTTDSLERVRSLGAIGVVNGVVGLVQADSGLYQSSTAPAQVSAALADAATARVFCASQTGPALTTLGTQTITAGVHTMNGNATLISGTVWTLTGSASDVFIFNVTGNLTLNATARVLLDGPDPRNVFWRIGGDFLATDETGLQGVVLAGGTIHLLGSWLGATALLASGDIDITEIDALAGVDLFFNPNGMWQAGCIPQPIASVLPGLCTLIANGSFETPYMPAVQPANGSFGHSNSNCLRGRTDEVADWNNANEASPDWYKINYASPPGYVGPSAPRTGQAYAGLYASNDGAQRQYREYVYQKLAAPLQNQLYYVEFYTQLADYCLWKVPELGIRLDISCPWQNTMKTLLDPVTRQPLLAHISTHEPDFNNPAEWRRTAGIYPAMGGEQFVTIGRFGDLSGTGFVNRNISPPTSIRWRVLLPRRRKPVPAATGDYHARAVTSLRFQSLHARR